MMTWRSFHERKRDTSEPTGAVVSPIREFWQWWADAGRDLDMSGHTEATQTLQDLELALAQTQFGIELDADQQRVHVQVYHPDYQALPDEARTHISLMVLEWAVGEDDLERWIGAVEPLVGVPTSPVTDEEVRGTVAQLLAARDPEEWKILHGEGEGGEIIRVIARAGAAAGT